MQWTDPIDAYCERLSDAFWAEPVNAVSNLAFLVVAIAAFLAWRQVDARTVRRRRDVASLSLIAVVAVIGVGSFLFHTFANRWSGLADVIPITLFIAGYLCLALHRFIGLPRWGAVLSVLAFFFAAFLAGDLLARLVGSSSGYVPPLLALYAIGISLVVRRRSPGKRVLGAAGVFTLSIALRMADMPLCAAHPLGTHFLWHVLNAATLGLLLSATIRFGVRPRKRRITH